MNDAQIVGLTTHQNYKQMITRYNREDKVLWHYMNPSPRPCFTLDLLSDFKKFHQDVKARIASTSEHDSTSLRYVVLASYVPKIFNLGGDLALFKDLILNKDKDGLFRYAKACIDPLYDITINFDLPITHIALVQGDALGGGFEVALASTVLIAERSARMGFPEILFNLFPGMGAYSLLARRIGAVKAEKIILSGRIYNAEELYDMGVVDMLAEDGTGEQAVSAYIKKENKHSNGYKSVYKVRRIYHPLTYKELLDITTLWVDAALQLHEKDLRIMERLARSQDKLMKLGPVGERREATQRAPCGLQSIHFI
jgi:DSF synthase